VVIIAIHVGNLQFGFENGCFEGHGVAYTFCYEAISELSKWPPDLGEREGPRKGCELSASTLIPSF
jgi:hypothetical protein